MYTSEKLRTLTCYRILQVTSYSIFFSRSSFKFIIYITSIIFFSRSKTRFRLPTYLPTSPPAAAQTSSCADDPFQRLAELPPRARVVAGGHRVAVHRKHACRSAHGRRATRKLRIPEAQSFHGACGVPRHVHDFTISANLAILQLRLQTQGRFEFSPARCVLATE